MVVFSLTPALSHWEREKHSQLFVEVSPLFHCEKENGFSMLVYKFYEASQRLFPLPAGEG